MNINLRVVGIAALLVLTMLLGIRFRQQRTAIMLQNYRELSAVATRVAGFLQGNDFGSLIQMIEPSARATLTESKLRRRWREFVAAIGAPQGWELGQWNVIGHIATVQVHFRGATRAGTMELKLRSDGRKWRIVELHFER
jgi:hypothetical protein